jgi:hypothetical protein
MCLKSSPESNAIRYSQYIFSTALESKNTTTDLSKGFLKGNNTGNLSFNVSPKYSYLQSSNLIKNLSQNNASLNTTPNLTNTNLNTSSIRGTGLKVNSTIQPNQNPLLLILQFIVSGLAAGAALFMANIALDKYRSPHLLVDKEAFLETVIIDLTLYQIDIPSFSRELRDFKVQYIVNRVIIKNKGRSAAENCKGALKINNSEEKICWSIPSERYKMTINVDSSEYLDVCAVLWGNAEEIFRRLNEHIDTKFGDGRNGGTEAKKYVRNIYQNHNDIPIIIAPTENGWLPAKDNRRINPGPSTIIVTAKNNRPSLKLDITILETPTDNGRIIQLR